MYVCGIDWHCQTLFLYSLKKSTFDFFFLWQSYFLFLNSRVCSHTVQEIYGLKNWERKTYKKLLDFFGLFLNYLAENKTENLFQIYELAFNVNKKTKLFNTWKKVNKQLNTKNIYRSLPSMFLRSIFYQQGVIFIFSFRQMNLRGQEMG